MNTKPFFLPQAEYERLRSIYPKFNEPWQTAEVDELKAMYADHVPLTDMSEQLGRTPSSLKLKLKALGLYEPKPAPKAWTEDDDKILIQMYNEDKPFEEMATHFVRTEKAIISRLVHLRVKLFNERQIVYEEV